MNRSSGSEQSFRKAELAVRKAELAVSKAELAVRKAELAVRKAELTVRKAELAARKAELAARERRSNREFRHLTSLAWEQESCGTHGYQITHAGLNNEWDCSTDEKSLEQTMFVLMHSMI